MLSGRFRMTLRLGINLLRMGDPIRVTSPQVGLLNVGQAFEVRRTIFSDDYLGLDLYTKASQKVRLATADEEGFKLNMIGILETSGTQNIFTDDLLKLINFATSEKDFQLLRSILIECLKDDFRSVSFYKPLSSYFLQCLSQLLPDEAAIMWNSEVLQNNESLRSKSIALSYLTLLYRCEKYEELVETYKTIRDPTLSEATLVMVALAKIGTKDAFLQASEIIRQAPISVTSKSKSSGGRVTAAYAYLAYKIGQNGPAYDVLTNPQRVGKPSKFTTNLKLLILTEVGRLHEALVLIRSELLPSRDVLKQSMEHRHDNDLEYKRIVFIDVMKKLTTAIRNENDPELSKELSSICKALDHSAVLSEEPLEDLIYKPITRSSTKSNRFPPREKRDRGHRERETRRNIYLE